MNVRRAHLRARSAASRLAIHTDLRTSTVQRGSTIMLASSDTERTRLFVTIDAEVRAARDEGEALVQGSIFSYLNEKVPGLPRNIFQLETFDHESGLLSAERIYTSTLRIWACRLSEPDSEVPGRSWSLELAVGENEGKLFFGSRLRCFSRHLDFHFDPAVPRVYRDLVSQNILYGDGIKLSRAPIDIESEDEVEWLVALISNPRRVRNIVTLSANGEGFCTVTPNRFAERLCGVAHVVRIYPNASFKLSDVLGAYLSVYDLGIRIYRPTPQIEGDDPLTHTLYTRHALARTSLERVQHSILSDAFMTTVSGALRSQSIPTFAQIRSASATLRLAQVQASGSTNQLLTLQSQLKAARDGCVAAEAQAREALDLAVQEEMTRKEVEDERNQERSRAMVLSARLRLLEAEHSPSTEGAAPRPKNYGDIAWWAERQFAGRVKLHARALRGLKIATFNDLELVCDLVKLLAHQYVDSKRGNREAWKQFEDEIKARGVEFSKSISGARAGEQGEEYFVRYKGRREFLEWHLKKGTSRDPARDLRVYFFWDDEDEEVVIGYLPGHLDTRIT